MHIKPNKASLAPLLVPEIIPNTNDSTDIALCPNQYKILLFLRPLNSIRGNSSRQCLEFLRCYPFIHNITVVCQGDPVMYLKQFGYMRDAKWLTIQTRENFENLLHQNNILILPSDNEGVPQTVYESFNSNTVVLDCS